MIAYASAPPPSPTCFVSGIIKTIGFEENYQNPCLLNPGRCPTDTELSHPPRYLLGIQIKSAIYQTGEIDYFTCNSLFPKNSTKFIYLNQDKTDTDNPPSLNQLISGNVISSGKSFFDTFTLKESNIFIKVYNWFLNYFYSLFPSLKTDG